jgi:hypothetical protein
MFKIMKKNVLFFKNKKTSPRNQKPSKWGKKRKSHLGFMWRLRSQLQKSLQRRRKRRENVKVHGETYSHEC